ncbi:MAG: cyclic nucleotide-binding domain-containing protein [bacterium]|jgi:CRP-like cAMP-binding protein|nr:cyclic nucleotide-binding domain-containing protein [bacterium]
MTPAPVVISEVERLLYLKSLPLPRLDSRTLGRMAAHLSERTYSKGEVLQELNVMPTRFQVVVDGEVEILSGGGDTQTAVSRDLIGILSVMARDSRGLSAVARRKTLVLEGSTDFLLHEMQGNHAMARVAIQRICGEITRTLTSADSASDCLPTPESDLQAPSRRLDIIERLTVIRRHTRIGTFNVDALMELARRCEEIRPQPGEIIWRRGEPARAMHIFVKGQAEGRRPGCACITMGCGHHLENFVALSGREHLSEGVAVTPTVILKIAAESLFDVLEDRPYMAADMIAMFGRLLIDMRGHAQLPCNSF